MLSRRLGMGFGMGNSQRGLSTTVPTFAADVASFTATAPTGYSWITGSQSLTMVVSTTSGSILIPVSLAVSGVITPTGMDAALGSLLIGETAGWSITGALATKGGQDRPVRIVGTVTGVTALPAPAQMAAPALTGGERQVILTFAAAPAANPTITSYGYQITLAADTGFASPTVQGTQADRTPPIVATPLSAGSYIARTRATNAQGNGEWSAASAPAVVTVPDTLVNIGTILGSATGTLWTVDPADRPATNRTTTDAGNAPWSINATTGAITANLGAYSALLVSDAPQAVTGVTWTATDGRTVRLVASVQGIELNDGLAKFEDIFPTTAPTTVGDGLFTQTAARAFQRTAAVQATSYMQWAAPAFSDKVWEKGLTIRFRFRIATRTAGTVRWSIVPTEGIIAAVQSEGRFIPGIYEETVTIPRGAGFTFPITIRLSSSANFNGTIDNVEWRALPLIQPTIAYPAYDPADITPTTVTPATSRVDIQTAIAAGGEVRFTEGTYNLAGWVTQSPAVELKVVGLGAGAVLLGGFNRLADFSTGPTAAFLAYRARTTVENITFRNWRVAHFAGAFDGDYVPDAAMLNAAQVADPGTYTTGLAWRDVRFEDGGRPVQFSRTPLAATTANQCSNIHMHNFVVERCWGGFSLATTGLGQNWQFWNGAFDDIVIPATGDGSTWQQFALGIRGAVNDNLPGTSNGENLHFEHLSFSNMGSKADGTEEGNYEAQMIRLTGFINNVTVRRITGKNLGKLRDGSFAVTRPEDSDAFYFKGHNGILDKIAIETCALGGEGVFGTKGDWERPLDVSVRASDIYLKDQIPVSESHVLSARYPGPTTSIATDQVLLGGEYYTEAVFGHSQFSNATYRNIYCENVKTSQGLFGRAASTQSGWRGTCAIENVTLVNMGTISQNHLVTFADSATEQLAGPEVTSITVNNIRMVDPVSLNGTALTRAIEENLRFINAVERPAADFRSLSFAVDNVSVVYTGAPGVTIPTIMALMAMRTNPAPSPGTTHVLTPAIPTGTISTSVTTRRALTSETGVHTTLTNAGSEATGADLSWIRVAGRPGSSLASAAARPGVIV